MILNIRRGYRFRLDGAQEEMQKAFKSLALALVVAVASRIFDTCCAIRICSFAAHSNDVHTFCDVRCIFGNVHH